MKSKKQNEKKENKVTQDDVARHAGVTRSMVSYVLNNSSRSVSGETRERILEAIDVLGYRPNKFAQGLMRGDEEFAGQRQIGIVLNSSEVLLRPYYTEIIAGIHAEAHSSQYHIRFIRFFNDLKNPILFNELIHHEEICGLILVSLDQSISDKNDEKLIHKIRDRIRNVVCVEWQCDGLPCVNFDRQEAARSATDYLIQKGYESICYIGESDNRVSGFRQALLDAGKHDIRNVKIEFASDMRTGYEAVSRMISDGEIPRAVFAGSDEVAIGVLRFLNMKKIQVPGSVAIISIDNIEMSEFTNPPLTTINVQKSAMGRQAVQMIIRNYSSGTSEAVSVSLPTNIIIRESC